MKPKPNTDHFQPKKDPSLFLDGGALDQADKKQQSSTTEQVFPVSETRTYREQKVFRLSLDLINLLKREAFERSTKKGSRVTETELVEAALRAYLE